MEEAISVKELVAEAQAAYKQGDYLAAARAFEAAAQGYLVQGEGMLAAEMRNNSSVAYLQAGDASSALRVVTGTPQVFEQAGDVRRHGMALGNLAAALEGLNRLDEAAQAYHQSGQLLKLAGEQELYLHVMQSLSALQLRTGRHLEAVSTMRDGLESLQRPNPRQRLLKALLQIPSKLFGKLPGL
jgi:tetratricopeptide (TPR) repeat protein